MTAEPGGPSARRNQEVERWQIPAQHFVGAVPANYDRYLGPILFHHYADDLVARLSVTPGMRVLETACGNGIVTRRLVDRLGARGTLVATDLNQAVTARQIAHRLGDQPVRCPLRAHVFTAHRPAS